MRKGRGGKREGGGYIQNGNKISLINYFLYACMRKIDYDGKYIEIINLPIGNSHTFTDSLMDFRSIYYIHLASL